MRQLFTIAVAIITIAIGLSISLVVFAVLAFLGSIAGAYFWWKTRELRRQLKQHIEAHTRSQQSADEGHGAIIEGEWQRDGPLETAREKPLLHSANVDTDSDRSVSTPNQSSRL